MLRLYLKYIFPVLLFFSIVLVCGCSKEKSPTGYQGIGDSGGQIGVNDSTSIFFGAVLEIPPGALDEKVKIRLTEVTNPPSLPTEVIAIGGCLMIDPAETELLKSCR